MRLLRELRHFFQGSAQLAKVQVGNGRSALQLASHQRILLGGVQVRRQLGAAVVIDLTGGLICVRDVDGIRIGGTQHAIFVLTQRTVQKTDTALCAQTQVEAYLGVLWPALLALASDDALRVEPVEQLVAVAAPVLFVSAVQCEVRRSKDLLLLHSEAFLVASDAAR